MGDMLLWIFTAFYWFYTWTFPLWPFVFVVCLARGLKDFFKSESDKIPADLYTSAFALLLIIFGFLLPQLIQ